VLEVRDCQELFVVLFVMSEYVDYSRESDDMSIVREIMFYILIMNLRELQTD
jgi:hypothetical protein